MNNGMMNSGNLNVGDKNAGNMNVGDKNAGSMNCGSYNSGIQNEGSFNSGIANKCNGSNGVFCNKDDDNIRIFNKPSGVSLQQFMESEYMVVLESAPFPLVKEVEIDGEKSMKVNTMEEAWKEWWSFLSPEDREVIKRIPNFDAEIFKDITGIDVNEE